MAEHMFHKGSGSRIKELRHQLGLSRKDMAGQLVIENKPGLAELFEWMDREPLLYHEA
jgi:transcriptional regulator with XRE-family HTH domain